MLTCDKCSGQINEGSKFCPHCGDPVTEDDQPSVVVSGQQVADVEITFGRSSSANYEQAVAIAQNIPSYIEEGEGREIRHRVKLPITEVELILNLHGLVGTWKSSRMLINGQPAQKSDLVYHGMGCYRNRQKAYDRDRFCFGEADYEANIWGCKRMGMPVIQWGGWLEYGKLDQAGVWHFDKDRIRHELELKIEENKLCPVLDRARILETLDRMPDSVNPKSDPNWEYTTTYEDIPDGGYREVATGVRPVVKRVSRYVVGEYRPAWDDFDKEEQPATQTIEVELKLPSTSQMPPRSQSRSGCLGMIAAIVSAVSTLAILAFAVSP